jgi:hypothetical protein
VVRVRGWAGVVRRKRVRKKQKGDLVSILVVGV